VLLTSLVDLWALFFMSCEIRNLLKSVVSPLLFKIYTCDLPLTFSRKYAYVADLAVMHADGDWQAVKRVLCKDMEPMGKYFQNRKIKLSTTKMVSGVFHFNNKETKHELKVNFNKTQSFTLSPNTSK